MLTDRPRNRPVQRSGMALRLGPDARGKAQALADGEDSSEHSAVFLDPRALIEMSHGVDEFAGLERLDREELDEDETELLVAPAPPLELVHPRFTRTRPLKKTG